MSALPVLTPLRVHQTRTAIVFIHGFSGSPGATWGLFPDFLAADARLSDWDIFSFGYSTSITPDLVGLWSADASIDVLAQLLETALSTGQLAAYGSLALAAHSMGGLVVQRALMDKPALEQRISHVALFGTPSGGLPKASPFGFWKRQVRDMSEGSPFITDLRGRWNQRYAGSPPFRFVTVAGDQDEFVPATSSLDPFPQEEWRVVPGDHLDIVKPDQPDSLSVQLYLTFLAGEHAAAEWRSAARIALESRDFTRIISNLAPNEADLDGHGLVDLALALEGAGRQDEAIALLERRLGENTDPMGVLAGRLKRRWLAGHRRSDFERALELYRKGYALSSSKPNHAQAYYHGINVAFLELAQEDPDEKAAAAMATEVLQHCAAARRDQWKSAAMADANLILGNTAEAMNLYAEAMNHLKTPREFVSMLQQGIYLADLLGAEQAAAQLRAWHEGGSAATA